MFFLGLLLAGGTAVYCWVTGDWPTGDQHRGLFAIFALATWMMFSVARKALWGRS